MIEKEREIRRLGEDGHILHVAVAQTLLRTADVVKDKGRDPAVGKELRVRLHNMMIAAETVGENHKRERGHRVLRQIELAVQLLPAAFQIQFFRLRGSLRLRPGTRRGKNAEKRREEKQRHRKQSHACFHFHILPAFANQRFPNVCRRAN